MSEMLFRARARRRGVRLTRRRSMALWVGLLLLALLGNLVFWLASARWSAPLLEPRPANGSDVLQAVPLGDGRALLATRGNDVRLVDDGHTVASRRMREVVAGVAAGPDGSPVYLGTSEGTLHVLTPDLKDERALQVDHGVVGLVPTADGGVLVAHGAGAFSDQYWVSRFAPGADEPTSTQQAVFTVTALGDLDGQAVYGTIDARVVAPDPAGGDAPAWTAQVPHPVTSLLTLPGRGQIAVGDEGGGLTLLTADGKVLGTATVGDYPLTAVAYDAGTRQFVVADQHGDVHVLDEAGQVLHSTQAASSPIATVAPRPSGGLLVVPQSGRWATIDPAAVDDTVIRGRLVAGWVAFNAVIGLGLLAGAVVSNPAARVAFGGLARTSWRGKAGYAFALPALALIVVFSYYPALSALYYSFTDFNLRSPREWIGLDNYVEIFTADPYFRAGLGNMAIIVVASFLKTVTVPLLAAELVYWLRNQIHQYVFRTLFVLSAVVPGLVLTLLWRQVYDPNVGLLNQFLALIGLEQFQRAWLGDEGTALWAVIGVGFPYLSFFPFLIFLGGLLSINRELYDAAAIDGAGFWQRFRYIDLSSLKPQFRIMSFFAVTGAIEGFASIFVLTDGGPGTATYVPALEMFKRIGQGDLGYASALGVVLFVMILVVTVAILRFRRSPEEAG